VADVTTLDVNDVPEPCGVNDNDTGRLARGVLPPAERSTIVPTTALVVGKNDATPAFTSSLFNPVTVPPIRLSLINEGVVRSAAMISAVVADGLAWRIRTAAPATCGEAIDVPLSHV
jgi:hypothetical protein